MALGAGSSTFVDIVNGVRTRFSGLTASLGALNAGYIVGLNSAGKIDISMESIGVDSYTLRPPASTYSILNTSRFLTSGTLAPNNKQFFFPFFVSQTTLVTNLGTHVTTASATTTFSVGIYANNTGSGTSDAPTGNPLASVSGLSSTATGVVIGALNSPITLQPNTLYWLSLSTTSTATTYGTTSMGCQMGFNNGIGIISGYSITAPTGSLLLSPIGATSLSEIATAPFLFLYS